MKIYNYSEARQNFTTLLNAALTEEVIIARKDGSRFKVVSVEKTQDNKSPLEEVKGVKTNITIDELVEIIREGREGRGYLKRKY
jgi:PHD/YefM family antitoxin component YafN of YafNO toxin-antitoxin module